MSQIVGYKGDTILIEINTYDYDYIPVTVSSAIINIYSVDASGTKTYAVTDGNMIISDSLCTYMWTAPDDPSENDFIFEILTTDSNGYESLDRGQIVLQSVTGASPDPGSGLSDQEHTWLHNINEKTTNLSYDSSNYLKADIYAVTDTAVTDITDFRADVSDVGLKQEEHDWLESAYNQTVNFTFDASNYLEVSLNSEQKHWIENTYNRTALMLYDTNGYLKVDIEDVNGVNVTIDSFKADISLLALQSTSDIILNNVNATYNKVVNVQNTMGLEDTNNLILDAVNDNKVTMTNSIDPKVSSMYNILAGNMFIDSNTGIITHYKVNTTNVEVQFQLKDKDNINTIEIGESYGRARV